MDRPIASPARARVQFRAAAQLRNPVQFARTSGRSMRASLPIARRLFVRDIHARYRLSAFGFAWIILPAIAQTMVWLLLNKANILNSGKTEIPLPLFILIGTLLWQAFVEAIFSPGSQLAASAQMLSQVAFPPESLLLSGLADVAINSVIRLIIAVPLLVYYDVRPGWGVLLAPFGVASLLLFGFAIGLAIAPFGVLYQDLTRLLTVVTGFWLLITPVAYALPTSSSGLSLMRLNPVTPLLDATRGWLTGGGIWPGTGMVIVVGLSFGLVVVGWSVFRLSVPHLVDRVGS